MLNSKVEEFVRKVEAKSRFEKEASLFLKETLTQKEVCELFDVSKLTVIRWENRGLVKGEKVGKTKIYQKTDILQVFESSNKSRVNYIKDTSLYFRQLQIERDQRNLETLDK